MRIIKDTSIILSILTTVFLTLAGLTSVLKITVPSLIFGFVLIPCFIAVMVCIHYLLGNKMKLLNMLGIVSFVGDSELFRVSGSLVKLKKVLY